jgi:linoleate 10R-lipoxygenase
MMLVTLITSNVQNDGFISKVLANAEHSTIHTLAYNIFAETVPSALLFSAAISSVVDYYADPSRKDELQELIQLSTAVAGDGTDHALMRFIAPVLGKSSATSHLTLEAHQKVARRQDVSSINQRK